MSLPQQVDLVVVGAGISGLGAGVRALAAGRDVVVLEGSGRAGGVIESRRHDGYLFDTGPNSTLGNRPGVKEWVAELGLDPLDAAPEAKYRYVVKGGRLVPLPLGPVAFLKTPLFSLWAKLRLLAEPLHGRAEAEETVAQFVRRRLGPEFLDYAVGPFVSGVYAGDPERLSVRAAVAKIYNLERDHGGLLRGALAKRNVSGQPKGGIFSFAGGLGALPEAMAAKLGERLFLDTPVKGLKSEEGGMVLDLGEGRRLRAREVWLAVPAEVSANLVAPLAPVAEETLRQIPYAAVAQVFLAYRKADIPALPKGFGFLIPRVEGIETLGCLFSSQLFPGRCPDDRVALTAYVGGRTNPDGALRLPAQIVAGVREDLKKLLGIQAEPVYVDTARHARAIPQYELGHEGRIATIERALAPFPIKLVGNIKGGVAVADRLLFAQALG